MRTIVAWLWLCGVWAAAGDLTVVLVNHAGVPPQVLAKAENQYIRVFSSAGVEARWVRPPIENGRMVIDASAVVIHLVSRSQPNHPRAQQNCLGKALAISRDRPVNTAVVFYDHIKGVMARREFDVALLLAHVMAHETGHLLLGARHSVTGVMKEAWSEEDYYHIKQGFGLFTVAEQRRLKDAIERRHPRIARTRQDQHDGTEATTGDR